MGRDRERERERERERTKQFSCRRTSGAQPNGSLKNEDESPGRPLTPLRAFESVSGRTSISVLAPLLERRKNPFSKSRDRIREREREREREGEREDLQQRNSKVSKPLHSLGLKNLSRPWKERVRVRLLVLEKTCSTL